MIADFLRFHPGRAALAAVALWLLTSWSAAAGPTVAVLGEGDRGAALADLVVAGDAGFTFVERGAIEQILKERKIALSGLTGRQAAKLAALLKADLFVLIQVRDETGGRVVIFESANGFRLTDADVPADGAAAVQGEIRRAAGIVAAPADAIFISVAGVRDGGVPRRRWIDAARTADEAIRMIMRSDRVVLLEREYLMTLTREKALTGAFGSFAAAARLLQVELLPGRDAEEFIVELRLLDAAGATLFSTRVSSTEPDAAHRLAAQLTDFLQTAPPPAVEADAAARQREAARFFAEAKWYGGETGAHLDKLRTAWLLDPANPGYRRALMNVLGQYGFWYRLGESGAPFDVWMMHLELVMQVGGVDFGEPWLYRKNRSRGRDEDVFERMPGEAILCALEELWKKRSELSPVELERIRETAAAWRDYMRRRLDRTREREARTSKPAQKADALNQMIPQLFEPLPPYCYFDDAVCTAAGADLLDRQLPELFNKFYAADLPEDCPFNRNELVRPGWLLLRHLAATPDPAGRARQLAERFGALKVLGFRRMALVLKGFAALYASPFDPAQFNATVKELAEEGKALGIDSADRGGFVLNSLQLGGLAPEMSARLSGGARSSGPRPAAPLPERVAAGRGAGQATTETAGKSPAAGDRWAAVIAAVGKLREGNKINDPGFPWVRYRQTFEALKKAPDFTPELAAALSPDFAFERVWPAAYSTLLPAFSIVAATADRAGNLFILTRHAGASMILYRLTPDGRQAELLGGSADPDTVAALSKASPRAFSVSENQALLVIDGRMLLMPLNGAKWRFLADWPGGVHTAAVAGGRLWGSGGELLVSSDLNGNDRITHFSNRREDDPLLNRPEGRLKLEIIRIVPVAADESLLLFCRQGIWRLVPKRNTLAPLWRSKDPNGVFWSAIEEGGDNIYGRFGMDVEALVEVNPASGAVKFPAAFARVSAKRGFLDPDRWLAAPPPGRGAFVAQGGLYYFAAAADNSNSSRVWTPAGPAASPFWFCPQAVKFFRHPDGTSVLMATDRQVMKVTLKKGNPIR